MVTNHGPRRSSRKENLEARGRLFRGPKLLRKGKDRWTRPRSVVKRASRKNGTREGYREGSTTPLAKVRPRNSWFRKGIDPTNDGFRKGMTRNLTRI